MKKNDAIICAIICCLMLGNISIFSSNYTELNRELIKFTPGDGDLPMNGSFSIEILNLGLNNSGDWYDLPTDIPFNSNQSFQIEFNATGLDIDQEFMLVLQLWSTHQNHSLTKHNDHQTQYFNTTSLWGNNATHSSIHDTQMIDGTSTPDKPISRLHGCYWLEFSVIDFKSSPNYLPSGISKRISFGEPCPSDDSDYDGWSDSQENLFGSNPDSNSSPPYTIYSEQIALYKILLDRNNQSQNVDSDGDSWSDIAEKLFGSNTSDSNSTPLTVLAALNALLTETTNDLLECQNDWNLTNQTLVQCQSSLDDSPLNNNDLDNDGWTDSVELLCGSDPNDGESMPTVFTGAICWELADEDLDGIRNMDDTCSSTEIDIEATNSTGCAVECETCNQNGEYNSSNPTVDDEIDVTGGGDFVDLVVIGGASLLAGIGITSVLGQPGSWEFKKPKIDASKKERIKDIVKEIDLDLDLDLDDNIKSAKLKKGETNSHTSDQYFKSGVERQKAMTTAADPLLDDYIEDESRSN